MAFILMGFFGVFEEVLESWTIVCSDGIQFNNKYDKDSKVEAYSKPCEKSKTKLFINITYYFNRLFFS